MSLYIPTWEEKKKAKELRSDILKWLWKSENLRSWKS